MSGDLTFDDLPEWTFDVREVCAGAYHVRGTDVVGRSVELSGTDYDQLVAEALCRARDLPPPRR